MVVSDIRRHKIMEEALRSIMGSGIPPSFKFEDTYSSIVFPQGYTVPNETTVTNKFNELLAVAGDNQKTSVLGDLEVGTANLYVDVSASSVGIGTPTPSATLQVVGNVQVSSNLEVGSKFIVDTTTSRVGVGTTVPRASLEVLGNTYVSSDLKVGTANLFVNSSGNLGIGVTDLTTNLHVNGNVYISSNLLVGSYNLHVDTTTGRVGLGRELDANLHITGTHEIESNLKVGTNTLHTDANTIRVGIGTTTPNSNLHVEGNVYASSNLEIGTDSLFVDTDTGKVGINTATPKSNLHVQGRIHQENERMIFDFENKRPKYLDFTTPFTYLATNTTTVNYVLVLSGTSIYDLSGGSEVVNNTTSDNVTGTLNVVAGHVYTSYKNGSNAGTGPFYIIGNENGVNCATMIPYACAGNYFGFANRDWAPIKIYVYAPYEDVTINEYVNKSILDTPSNTINITQGTLTSFTSAAGSTAEHNYILEAENGVIIAARSGTYDGSAGNRSSIMYPGSDLAYNMKNINNNTIGHIKNDVFSDVFDSYSHTIYNENTVYSPAGIPTFLSSFGDGSGTGFTTSIPYELLGDTYYIPHAITGFILGFVHHSQSITVEYYSGGSWTTKDTYSITDYNNSCVSPYNAGRYQVGKVGAVGTAFSGSEASATLWRFTSRHTFVLHTEIYQSEYHALGWLDSNNTNKMYRLPYKRGVKNYAKFNLETGNNVNSGGEGSVYYDSDWVVGYYGPLQYYQGFTHTNDYIHVPSPGWYRITLRVNFVNSDTTVDRRMVGVVIEAGGVRYDEEAVESYMRDDSDHVNATSAMSTIVYFPPTNLKLRLGFIRRTSSTGTYDVTDGSMIELERIQ
jgi:hypothetical protein